MAGTFAPGLMTQPGILGPARTTSFAPTEEAESVMGKLGSFQSLGSPGGGNNTSQLSPSMAMLNVHSASSSPLQPRALLGALPFTSHGYILHLYGFPMW